MGEEPSAPDAMRVLAGMTNRIGHRGPDGEGHAILPLPGGRLAAFGHRRLAIIDRATGVQPMKSLNDRFTIVFNGEIYNHSELRQQLEAKGARFRTRSDTEVILEAWQTWGEAALLRFRGMYAFALHDAEAGHVVLARDPFGKKPLYVAEPRFQGAPTLVFASAIEALLAHPLVRPDLETAAMHDFLCWRYAPGPGTFFRGVRKLVPGGCLVWNDGVTTERRYWLPPEEREDLAPPPRGDRAVEAFLEAFDDAVRLRLRADVAVGAFLSGGLDSAAVVATATRLGGAPIRTFSVGYAADPRSELSAAAETARSLGAVHTPVEMDARGLQDLVPVLSLRRGAPITEPSDLPMYLMAREASRHVKVVLSGEGSDEMFAGYPKHIVEAYLGDLVSAGAMAPIGRCIAGLTRLPGLGHKRRLAVLGRALATRGFEDRMVSWFGALTPMQRSAMWVGPEPAKPGVRAAFAEIPFHARAGASPLVRALHFDQASWLPDNTLERLDMTTMAASIEGRAPFMDTLLAEFAGGLPARWRLSGLTTKRIVRDALKQRLPAAVIGRAKNGFGLPVAAWFRGPLRQPFADLVLAPDASVSGFLRRESLRRLLDEHVAGKAEHEKTLWMLYALETFLRAFFRR